MNKITIKFGTELKSTKYIVVNYNFKSPTRTESFGGKRYIMIVVDDFTRYTWVILLQSKFDAPKHIEALCTRL